MARFKNHPWRNIDAFGHLPFPAKKKVKKVKQQKRKATP